MVVARKLAPVLLTLAALLLAGCAGEGDPGADVAEEAPPVEATATTGGIRGVVVDDRITPIAGARVEVLSAGKNVTTGDDGAFVFSGLGPGEYVVKASHPLFSTQQTTATVVAGDSEPKAVKIQLIRTVFANPYLETRVFEGFIVCSANVVVALSEECGEGVGVPGMGRVGGQGNNNVQFDFTIGAGVKTLVVEQAWEPTSEAGRAFYSPISTDWTCDPVCSGNTFGFMEGESPLLTHINNETLDSADVLPDETVISVFTWASREFTGVVLNQQFQTFVTTFHYVPAPEGWSFVAGNPDPFV